MKTIDTTQRRKIFVLVKAAYEQSGCSLSLDGFRHEQMDALGIESLSNCPAEKGLKLMNRLHRVIDDCRLPNDECGKRGAANPQSTIANRKSPAGSAGGRPKGILEWTGDQQAQLTKVEALLADMELPWDYADGIAKRMFGDSVLRVDSLNKRQLTAVISALMKRQKTYGGREYGPGTKEVSHG